MDNTAATQLEIEWRKLLVSRLQTPQRNIRKAIATEREAAETRQADIRQMSPTAEAAHEAFGYGYITEDEYLAIAEQLQSVNLPTAITCAAAELAEIIGRLKREIRDLEWELKPEVERERIRQANAEYKADILQKKEARRDG